MTMRSRMPRGTIPQLLRTNSHTYTSLFHNKVPSAAAAGSHGSYAASMYCNTSEVVDLLSSAEHGDLYESLKLYTDSSGLKKTLKKSG